MNVEIHKCADVETLLVVTTGIDSREIASMDSHLQWIAQRAIKAFLAKEGIESEDSIESKNPVQFTPKDSTHEYMGFFVDAPAELLDQLCERYQHQGKLNPSIDELSIEDCTREQLFTWAGLTTS